MLRHGRDDVMTCLSEADAALVVGQS